MSNTVGLVEKPMTIKAEVSSLSAENAIKGTLLRQMGIPQGYINMRISRLFGNTFRVNVFAKRGDPSAMMQENFIIESFFLKINDNHEIVSCDPPIPQKKYS